MSLTPLALEAPLDLKCSVCGGRLFVNNAAIVYVKENIVVLGDCCVGGFMSAVIQDYESLLKQHHAEHIIYRPSARQIADACRFIATVCNSWAAIDNDFRTSQQIIDEWSK